MGRREFQCEVEFVVGEDGREMKFKCCAELQKLIGSSSVVEQVFRRRLSLAVFGTRSMEHEDKNRAFRDEHICAFMTELKEILTRLVRDTTLAKTLPTSAFYGRIMAEIDRIGWDRVVSLDLELSNLSFSITDDSKREHTLQMLLNDALYPQTAPECQIDLPSTASSNGSRNPKNDSAVVQRYEWDPVHSHLKDVIDFYERIVARYQDFWTVMEDIDECTWVLEPDGPTRANKMRRIAVNTYCSMQIEVDPLKPRAIPTYRFLGAESEVAPLVQKLVHVKRWDPSALLRHNLESVLGIVFMKRPVDGSDTTMDNACGICYAYALDGMIPDKICDKCHRPFHGSCLSDWLQSDSSTKRSFGVLYGTCPYCSHKITVNARAASHSST